MVARRVRRVRQGRAVRGAHRCAGRRAGHQPAPRDEHTVTARCYVWYLHHPRLGRPALMVAAVQALAVRSVCAAPQASPATNSMALRWTRLRHSYREPTGDSYLAVAAGPDQIAATA